MKHTDGFDARRLRSRGLNSWRLRVVMTFGVLTAIAGSLLALFATASLLGNQQSLEIISGGDTGIAFLAIGIVVLLAGALLCRSARRRSRGSSDLSISRHLMRKR